MNIEKIASFLEKNRIPSYRLNQIKDWVFSGKAERFKDIKILPSQLREILDEEFKIFSFSVVNTIKSSENDAYKFAFRLKDDRVIETALFKNIKGEWVSCVSCQVGCPVMCVFCASGKEGLKRNLSSEEIFDQILYCRYFLVSNRLGDLKKVVFMGIGEPLLNYDNLVAVIKMINTQLKIGKRNISVSTFGYVPRIRDFARDLKQVNLALSLHSASDEVRKRLVPLAAKYPLSQIAKALADYIRMTNKKVFIEYVLLDRVNNRIKDAYRIRDFLKSIAPLRYFVLNLIPYNPVDSKFKTPPQEKILEFRNLLLSLAIETTIRKSYGKDVKGACGQLALGR